MIDNLPYPLEFNIPDDYQVTVWEFHPGSHGTNEETEESWSTEPMYFFRILSKAKNAQGLRVVNAVTVSLSEVEKNPSESALKQLITNRLKIVLLDMADMLKLNDAPLYLVEFKDAAHECAHEELGLAEIGERCSTQPVEAVGWLTHRSKAKWILSESRSWAPGNGWGYRDHLIIPAKNILRSKALRR